MSFQLNPLEGLVGMVFPTDPDNRRIQGQLQKNGAGEVGIQVLVLNPITFEVLTGTYSNGSGDFVIKDVPLSSGSYMLLARKDTESRPAARDNLSRNESSIILEFSAGGGQTIPSPVIGGRRLYLSGGKIRGLPPA